MTIQRRTLLGAGAAMVGAALWPWRAGALTDEAARKHVRTTVDKVLALVQAPGDTRSKAEELRGLLESTAAMPQIARFAAGVAWRDMSESQQERFTDAFTHFVSTVYARRFQDYSGQQVAIGPVVDAGRRGLLVKSTVTQGQGGPIAVDWLVSDRPGRVVIADIVIEGVSLLVTQREEVGNMLEQRGGNVDTLIEDLAAA